MVHNSCRILLKFKLRLGRMYLSWFSQQHTVTRLKTDENCLQSQDNLSLAHQDQRNSCQFYTVHFRINTVTVIKILDMPVWFIFGNTLNCKFIKNLNSMTVTKWTQSSVFFFEALIILYVSVQHHFLQMNLSVSQQLKWN